MPWLVVIVDKVTFKGQWLVSRCALLVVVVDKVTFRGWWLVLVWLL